MAQGNKNGVHGENSATFEQCFERLQEVVQKLTEGNLTLEEALSSFEEGMALADRCAKMLDDADLRVKQVSARAARAALEKLGELEEVVPRSSPADEGEILSFEIESYEERIVVDAPQNNAVPRSTTGNLAYSPLPSERRGSQTGRGGGAPSNSTQAASDSNVELDPLFEEDD